MEYALSFDGLNGRHYPHISPRTAPSLPSTGKRPARCDRIIVFYADLENAMSYPSLQKAKKLCIASWLAVMELAIVPGERLRIAYKIIYLC